MKWLTFRAQTEPGFRCNLPDLLMIGGTAAVTAWLYRTFPDSSLFAMPLYLFFSFFLFCNVFRFSNLLEAAWYLPFAALAVITLILFDLGTFWWVVLLLAEPWKWLLIAYCITREDYSGAGYALMAERRRRNRPPA